MTEQEWLTSTDPRTMLDWARAAIRSDTTPAALPDGFRAMSDRKLRLFACACCRRVWDGVECECGGSAYCERCRGTGRIGGLADPRSRRAVEVAERFADGQAMYREMFLALGEAHMARRDAGYERQGTSTPAHLAHIAVAADCRSILSVYSRTDTHQLIPPATQATLLRDVFGNPFRAVTIATAWLSWNGGTVKRMAESIRESRCWDDLPVLADALQDAGCEDAEILGHLRGEETVPCDNNCSQLVSPVSSKGQWMEYEQAGPGSRWVVCSRCGGSGFTRRRRKNVVHVRGCWVLDLLLGKE